MVKLFLKNSNLCDHNSPTSQTDRQTTCDRNTALCTKVHRAVKTSVAYPGIARFNSNGNFSHSLAAPSKVCGPPQLRVVRGPKHGTATRDSSSGNIPSHSWPKISSDTAKLSSRGTHRLVSRTNLAVSVSQPKFHFHTTSVHEDVCMTRWRHAISSVQFALK